MTDVWAAILVGSAIFALACFLLATVLLAYVLTDD